MHEGSMSLRLSCHDLQYQAGFQGTTETLILDHVQQTWSLLDVLFSEIPEGVSLYCSASCHAT